MDFPKKRETLICNIFEKKKVEVTCLTDLIASTNPTALPLTLDFACKKLASIACSLLRLAKFPGSLSGFSKKKKKSKIKNQIQFDWVWVRFGQKTDGTKISHYFYEPYPDFDEK